MITTYNLKTRTINLNTNPKNVLVPLTKSFIEWFQKETTNKEESEKDFLEKCGLKRVGNEIFNISTEAKQDLMNSVTHTSADVKYLVLDEVDAQKELIDNEFKIELLKKLGWKVKE